MDLICPKMPISTVVKKTFFGKNFGIWGPLTLTLAKMNKTSSWYDYYWNFRDLLQVLLPKVVSSCYLETILVIFFASG